MKPCDGCGLTFNRRRAARAAACAAVLSLLAGCAGVFDPVLPPASAKFFAAARASADGLPLRRARLTWERVSGDDGPLDVVEVKTPLGITQTRASISRDEASFKGASPAGREWDAWSAMLPPPHSIGYWLAEGRPDPAYSADQSFADGSSSEVARIYQHGWEIIYDERDELQRPIAVRMRRVGEMPVRAEINVRILKWLAPR